MNLRAGGAEGRAGVSPSARRCMYVTPADISPAARAPEARSATRPSRWSRTGDCACTALPTACARAPVPHNPVRRCGNAACSAQRTLGPRRRRARGKGVLQPSRSAAWRASAPWRQSASTTRMHADMGGWTQPTPSAQRRAAPRAAAPQAARDAPARTDGGGEAESPAWGRRPPGLCRTRLSLPRTTRVRHWHNLRHCRASIRSAATVAGVLARIGARVLPRTAAARCGSA